MEFILHCFLALLISCFNPSSATWRHYSTFTSFGSGDTIIQTRHRHFGPSDANRKWSVECLDGESMRISGVWCKFMFPYKPATSLYPYFSRCHVRNMTAEFHCFDTQNHERTSDTFVTGVRAFDYRFEIWNFPRDNSTPYKCCKVPMGYYIDYVSCYYVPTHDVNMEYYDNDFLYIVYCATGYVVTGMAKKQNPYDKEYHAEWLQCCRLGFGVNKKTFAPPVTYAPSGAPTLYGRSYHETEPFSAQYRSQYSSLECPDGVQNNTNFEHCQPRKLDEMGRDQPSPRLKLELQSRHRTSETAEQTLTSRDRSYLTFNKNKI